MVILEAMLAGLPSLVTANCGYASWVKQYNAGVVVPAKCVQQNINGALQSALHSADYSLWSQNGLAAGQEGVLFGMQNRAVDLLEQFAGVVAAPQGIHT